MSCTLSSTPDLVDIREVTVDKSMPRDERVAEFVRQIGNRHTAEGLYRIPGRRIGRQIVVLDDILDEGLTLAAIVERLNELGAKACYTAVATEKLNGKKKPIKADFVALTVPDRFVFGFGMDVRGHFRNLPAIYAMKGQ